SPTGKRIAYVQHHATDSFVESKSVWTRDSTGGDPQLVISGTKIGNAVYWASDGRLIYSVHEETNSNTATDSVWAIKVDPYTGKPNGSQQCLLKGWGFIWSLTVSADGKRAALLRSNMTNQVFVAEFDKNTLSLSAPHRLTLDDSANVSTGWTPDSKSVLFASNRNGAWRIFKQRIDQTTAEELFVEGRSLSRPRLNADGSEVLYLENYRPEDPNPSTQVSIMRKNLAGGAPQEVVRHIGIYNYWCARIPSTLCLFSTQEAGTTTLFSFDPKRGKGGEV